MRHEFLEKINAIKDPVEKINALPDEMNVFGDALTYYIGTIADLKALAAAVPRWIPCVEREPEKGGTYLVTRPWIHGPAVARGHYVDGVWWVDGEMWGVTAWMPMPAPFAATKETS